MSVQLAEQPEQSEQPDQPEPGESVGYVVTLLLNAAGARLLSEESGHPYRANQEGELHVEAVSHDDLMAQAREYGHVIRYRPMGGAPDGPNARALKDATTLVIQIREQPYVFADRYLALTRAVTELQVQAKTHADAIMKLNHYADVATDRLNGEAGEKSIEDLRKSVSGLLGRERI